MKPVRADDNSSIWCGLGGKMSVFIRWSASFKYRGCTGPGRTTSPVARGAFRANVRITALSNITQKSHWLLSECGVCSSAHNIRLCRYMSSLLSGTDNNWAPSCMWRGCLLKSRAQKAFCEDTFSESYISSTGTGKSGSIKRRFGIPHWCRREVQDVLDAVDTSSSSQASQISASAAQYCRRALRCTHFSSPAGQAHLE